MQRYAYLKTNDVVAELQRVLQLGDRRPAGGPHAYVAHFLEVAKRNDVLLISIHAGVPGGEQIVRDNISAYTYDWSSAKIKKRLGDLALKPAFTFIPRVITAVRVAYKLWSFKPSHTLCWATMFPLWTAYLAARARGSYFVYSRHNRLDATGAALPKRLTTIVDKFFIHRADAIVVHGPYLRDEVRKIGVSDERIFEYNWSYEGFNPALYKKRDKERRRICATNKTLLFLGRVTRLKGVFDLLNAIKVVLGKHPEIRLVYAGDGRDLPALRQRLIESRLEHVVSCVGFVPHEDLPKYLSESAIVVTPTRREYPEGRCMAALEGLLFGVPVIAPNFGPFPYFVEDGENGLLFQPNSTSDLVRVINLALENQELYRKLALGAGHYREARKGTEVDYSTAVEKAFDYARQVQRSSRRKG